MSDKTYVTFAGTVQQFGSDKPVVTRFEGNNTHGYRVNIRSAGSQASIGLTLWAEYENIVPHLTRGVFLAGDGTYTENQKDGRVYRNISVTSLAAVMPVSKVEVPVVNAVSTPAAAPAAPAPTF